MGSSRLPGKVLREVLGRPLLQYHIERLQRVQSIDELVVATSTEAGDDAIESFCEATGVACFRGSEEDVLDRFYQCAREMDADIIVRVTSDCPLIDPAIIDLAVESFRDAPRTDYLRTDPARYPRGLDAEVFSRTALEAAWAEAKDGEEREHVTPFLYRNPDRFGLEVFAEKDAHGVEYRLCVDEEDDFRLVSAVLEALYPDNPDFGWRHVVALLSDRPDLVELNAHVHQHMVSQGPGMHLSFRRVREEDAEMLLAWRTRPEITRHMYTDVDHDIEAQRGWIKKCAAAGDFRHFVIQYDESPVGYLSFSDINREQGRCETGFYVAERAPGQRFAGVLDVCMADYAFYRLGVRRIANGVLGGNERSAAFHEKAGFQRLKVNAGQAVKQGRAIDVHVYELTRDAWEARARPFPVAESLAAFSEG